MENYTSIDTACGSVRGLAFPKFRKFLGIPYAHAERFCYATPVSSWEGELDATHFGDACFQKRVWYEHLEIPERYFYYNEFRKGITFSHSEDCLNLNIFTPKDGENHPVLVFIHGGGFDSGCNYDTAIDGEAYAKRGVVFVSINYRVGVFGYLTHKDIKDACGREGNFGLDDQLVALRWIKDNIRDYGGSPDNITVMGQSAGAISIQYLCLSEKCNGLFCRAIMLSGGGMFPKFALPRRAEDTREYWLDLMQTAGVSDLDEFRKTNPKDIFTAWETLKERRKDNIFHTMPVVDGYLISDAVDKIMGNALDIDYMVGYTNNDMYAIIMAHIAHQYAKNNKVFLYYFDIDAPGEDKNAAFHSSDLRYVFGTLKNSHRPYTAEDEKVSTLMIDYICRFAESGNPNHPKAPEWKQDFRRSLHIVRDIDKIKMKKPNYVKLLHHTITKGEPK